ncbi:MAG: hypothetical protein QHH15_00665 [Candidatus Thermoplasmatota archaeon]|jgi:hypothetical protein|nr:hypothetical protein [Candidatus Thermoplasmatota archaeon]
MSEIAETPSFEIYKSPTEKLKNEIVRLLIDNIGHKSRSYNNPEEKHAFCAKTQDLSILLMRYTPKSKRVELQKWYDQLEQQKRDLRNRKDTTITEDKIKEQMLELEYKYALEVHKQNETVIMNSPIIDTEVEGELDVSDEDLVGIIQYKIGRKDDKRLEFSR